MTFRIRTWSRLIAIADWAPASRTPGFMDVVQRNQFLEYG
jgi:hypothetical protein